MIVLQFMVLSIRSVNMLKSLKNKLIIVFLFTILILYVQAQVGPVLQIHNEFKDIDDMTINKIQVTYGKELADLYRLHKEHSYTKPEISIYKITYDNYIVDIHSSLYDNDEDNYGSLIDDQNVVFVFSFRIIPLLGIKIFDEYTVLGEEK